MGRWFSFPSTMCLNMVALFSACVSTSLLEATKTHYWAKRAPVEVEPFEPWFVGSIIAPSAHIVTAGHYNIEPTLNYTITYAKYDADWHSHDLHHNVYSLNPQLSMSAVQLGVTDWMDIQFNAQFFHNHTQHRSATRLGDGSFGFDFQLLKDQDDQWWPAIRLSLVEIIPTGKYQGLNPHKLGIDGVGGGSFNTVIGLDFGRLYHCWGHHFLNAHLAFSCSVPARVHVHGFNSYGGGYGTNGHVHPGQSFAAVLAGEFNLNQRWVLACDLQNVYTAKTRFSGRPGVISAGVPASVGAPSSDALFLAPAVEYSWSSSVGCIGGVIFNLAGRNTNHSATVVFGVNFYGSTR